MYTNIYIFFGRVVLIYSKITSLLAPRPVKLTSLFSTWGPVAARKNTGESNDTQICSWYAEGKEQTDKYRKGGNTASKTFNVPKF